MEFKEGLKKWSTICKEQKQCGECPMLEVCPFQPDWGNKAEEIEGIINQRFPTRLQYFLKSFPNAELNEYGIPTTICCRIIGLVSVCPYREQFSELGNEEYCRRCWNDFLEDKKDGKL